MYGVFVFDAMTKGETDSLTGSGITKVAKLYEGKGGGENNFNFGVINASDIEVLGKESSNSDIKSISMYEKKLNEDTQLYEEVSSGTISTAYGSSYALYARSIIFNQTFSTT